MAKKRKKTHLVEDEAQRDALTSPVRQEILEHLVQIGPSSVRDLADRLERTPHALHYHVRRLLEVGLIAHTGSSKSGRRRAS